MCGLLGWERNVNGGRWACRLVLVPGVKRPGMGEVGAVGLGHARIVPLGPPMALLLYVVHCHGVAAVVQSST